MKAVMLSIRPEWCEKIAQGRKTIELRKSFPSADKVKTPFKCYIYCTSSNQHTCLMQNASGVKLIYASNYKTAIPVGGSIANGKVIGEFVCDAILSHCEKANADIAEQMSCVRREKILEYSGGKEVFGWHISELVIYDKPKELSEFFKPCIHGEKDISCFECEKSGYTQDMKITCYNRMERPPQSWCYVEGKG